MKLLNKILLLAFFNPMVNLKRIKSVIRINVIIQDDMNTVHKSSEKTQNECELDVDMLNELAIGFRKNYGQY